MRRYKELMARYGLVAMGVYFSTFVLSMTFFVLAIRWGLEVDGVTGEAGTLVSAYLATKALTFPRMGATVVATPVVARLLGRRPAIDALVGEGEGDAEDGAPEPAARGASEASDGPPAGS